jgi:protein tyrosine/serine phosphatase
MNPRHLRSSLLAGAAAALLIAASAAWYHAHLLPPRFAPVTPGQLYRSGAVKPAQLEYLYHHYGIRRVVCLLNPSDPQTQAEHAAAERLGIIWHNLPLPGDATTTPAQRQELLRLLLDPQAPPTLVHCAAGANRTGLAVGLYRLHHDGWTLDQVLTEMRQFGFQNLPKHHNLLEALEAEAAARQSSSSLPATAAAQP